MDLVYLDFAKAFDSVNHGFLLAKLKASGIDGAVLNWIKSYLSNRSCQVQVDGTLSEEAPCHSGVPKSLFLKHSPAMSQSPTMFGKLLPGTEIVR